MKGASLATDGRRWTQITIPGNRVVVAGMARSGLAAMELLREKGAIVQGVDSNTEGKPDVLPQTEKSFEGADLIVLSPGVPVDIPELSDARKRGVPIIGDLELAGHFLQGPIIGITGANGKTTTTAMIGHILEKSGIPVQVGGNIGTPPASMVKSSRPDQWNVLELSSFQLETTYEFHAKVGVAMNVTPDHLDRHHTFERYAAAKRRLFETQEPDDFAVLNADDSTAEGYARYTKAQVLWFSLTRAVTPGLWLENGRILFDGARLMDAEAVPLRGLHNIDNTMAAAAASRMAGATLEQIAEAVHSFPGVEHRLEFVRERNGVKYYNDSKATNVDATEKTIDAFAGGLWIILGGKDKDSDYTVLRDKLLQKARGVLLIGAAAEKIAAQLGPGLPLRQCGTLEAAVKSAAREATRGEVVLLAPACASFDQFDNFEHRGRVFKKIVLDL